MKALSNQLRQFIRLCAEGHSPEEAHAATGYSTADSGQAWKGNARERARRWTLEIETERERLGLSAPNTPLGDSVVTEHLAAIDAAIMQARQAGDVKALSRLISQRTRVITSKAMRKTAARLPPAEPKATPMLQRFEVSGAGSWLDYFESKVGFDTDETARMEEEERAINAVRASAPYYLSGEPLPPVLEIEMKAVRAARFRREMLTRLDSGRWTPQIETHYREHGHSAAIAAIERKRGIGDE